jgi:hypothetical protein
MPRSIHLGDVVTVKARLKEIALMIDSVSGRTVEAACEHTTITVRRNLPDNVAEIGDEKIADCIYADTTNRMASDDFGQGLDRRSGANPGAPDQCQ